MSDQVELVRRFYEAQEEMRAAMRAHSAAFRACREAGLEHRYDRRVRAGAA